MASPPSSPSESSLLAFTYDRSVREVDYPQDHDQSQPQTPASPSTSGPISHYPPHGGRTRTRSISSLDPSRLTSQKRRPESGNEEEYEMGGVSRKHASEDIDPFSKGELAVMSSSSLMVLALITVAVMLTLGKITL